jgi:monoamine oxidase
MPPIPGIELPTGGRGSVAWIVSMTQRSSSVRNRIARSPLSPPVRRLLPSGPLYWPDNVAPSCASTNFAQCAVDPPRARSTAISAASYDGAGKIGLQFRRRFWEEDEAIHGGRSWTDQEIGQIIYPSHGFQGRKGILVGIHSQYTTEFETAFSVSWPRVPWSRGSWRSETAAAHQALAVLRQPDGRVHFAGDYMTNMSSWMQGAFESAREAAMRCTKRALTRA